VAVLGVFGVRGLAATASSSAKTDHLLKTVQHLHNLSEYTSERVFRIEIWREERVSDQASRRHGISTAQIVRRRGRGWR